MIAALLSEQVWWFTARAGGIVALVLTAASVMWGLFLSSKIWDGKPTAKWLNALHRWFSGLAVTFTGVHIVGLVLDDYVHFGWAEILVPFASDWRPLPVALGVVSFHLLIAVQISSLFMNRLPRRWWKRVHLSSYALFWLGLVHGVTAGTDASHPASVALWSVLTLGVLFLTVYRALTVRPRGGRTVSVSPARNPLPADAPITERTQADAHLGG